MPTDRQRRETDARRARRQAQERAQREQARKRVLLIISVVGALVVAAVVVLFVVNTTDDSKGSKGSAGSAGAGGNCSYPSSSAPAARKVSAPAAKQPRTGTAVVRLATTRGAMTFTLDRAKAPCAAGSFVSLARQKYFDNTPCHRLTTAGIFVLQCGDPTGTGSAGPGYTFADELSGTEKYTRGVLAMANSGADTNGSQFFIVYKDSTGLGPQYTIFGKVTSGLGVVDAVAAKGAVGGSDGKPKEPISITKATAG